MDKCPSVYGRLLPAQFVVGYGRRRRYESDEQSWTRSHVIRRRELLLRVRLDSMHGRLLAYLVPSLGISIGVYLWCCSQPVAISSRNLSMDFVYASQSGDVWVEDDGRLRQGKSAIATISYDQHVRVLPRAVRWLGFLAFSIEERVSVSRIMQLTPQQGTRLSQEDEESIAKVLLTRRGCISAGSKNGVLEWCSVKSIHNNRSIVVHNAIGVGLYALALCTCVWWCIRAAHWWRQFRQGRWIKAGRCALCGYYMLRMNTCPECGFRAGGRL